jgi:branched-chain amino acid transport system substrate-binding protein
MSFCLRVAGYSFAVAFTILGLLVFGRPAAAEETIKLAYTDPFSGPFASGGDEFLSLPGGICGCFDDSSGPRVT